MHKLFQDGTHSREVLGTRGGAVQEKRQTGSGTQKRRKMGLERHKENGRRPMLPLMITVPTALQSPVHSSMTFSFAQLASRDLSALSIDGNLS